MPKDDEAVFAKADSGMMASELVTALQRFIAQHGDIVVWYEDDYDHSMSIRCASVTGDLSEHINPSDGMNDDEIEHCKNMSAVILN